MYLDEAKSLILAGFRFGDVFPFFVGTSADRVELVRWFVSDLPACHAPGGGATAPRDESFAPTKRRGGGS